MPPHQRVIRKHAAANEQIRTFHERREVRELAPKTWQACISLGDETGSGTPRPAPRADRVPHR